MKPVQYERSTGADQVVVWCRFCKKVTRAAASAQTVQCSCCGRLNAVVKQKTGETT